MKKKFLTILIFGYLNLIPVISQSHIFEYNEIMIYKDNVWGRWEISGISIGITAQKNGTFKISFYALNESQPREVKYVRFSNMEIEGWFKYEDVDRRFYLQTSNKLSDMSRGISGIVYIFPDSGSNDPVAYKLSDL